MKMLVFQLTLCMLCPQGLQDVIGLSVVHPTWQRTRPDDPEDLHNGWTFAKPGDPPFKSPAGAAAPPLPAVPTHPPCRKHQELHKPQVCVPNEEPPTCSVPRRIRELLYGRLHS